MLTHKHRQMEEKLAEEAQQCAILQQQVRQAFSFLGTTFWYTYMYIYVSVYAAPQ